MARKTLDKRPAGRETWDREVGGIRNCGLFGAENARITIEQRFARVGS
jgi:hypothetical protein